MRNVFQVSQIVNTSIYNMMFNFSCLTGTIHNFAMHLVSRVFLNVRRLREDNHSYFVYELIEDQLIYQHVSMPHTNCQSFLCKTISHACIFDQNIQRLRERIIIDVLCIV